MKTKAVIISVILLSAMAFAGQWVIESKHRFLGYNIGSHNKYLNTNYVPDGQSGVTALCTDRDGNVFGGTTSTDGKTAWIVRFTNANNVVTVSTPLRASIPGQTKIPHPLINGRDGYIYGGTSIYEDLLYVPVDSLANRKYKGGHIFRCKVGKAKRRDGPAQFEIQDLGIVMPGEGIRTLAADLKRQRIYGLTEPHYKFFIFDMKTRKSRVFKNVDLLDEKDNSFMYIRLVRLGSALVVAKNGRVYGSAYESRLFRYDPETDKLKVTDIVVPHGLGHEEISAVSAFVRAGDGAIYGGTSTDGILFRFDTRTGKMDNLGKPDCHTNIRSLVVTNDGTVCGVLGQEGFPTTLFKYKDGAYELIGQIKCTVFKTGYTWYASNLAPAVYLKEGTIIFGNKGRIGKLFAYYNN